MKIVSVFVGCRTTVLVNWSFFTPSITMVVTIQYTVYNMAIQVVEFSNGGYKIRKVFA